MAKGNLTLRIDSELKAQASELFKALGLDLSATTGIFYRQDLRCHGLPFEVKQMSRMKPHIKLWSMLKIMKTYTALSIV